MADPASFIGAGTTQLPTYPPPRETASGGCCHSEGIRPGMPEESRRDAPAWHRQGHQRAGEIPRHCAPRNDRVELSGRPVQNDGAPPDSQRRAYNLEYMRLWRQRNRERYLEYNRAYQRKTAPRRKLREMARDAALGPKCAYGCGRRATQTIGRIDPRTWQPVSVPYCGSC